MFLGLIIICVLLVVPDFYIWHAFLRGHCAWYGQLLHWLPTLSVAVAIAVSLLGTRSIFVLELIIFVLLCFALPKVAFSLLALLRLPKVGLIIALLLAAAMVYGYAFGWKHLVTKEVTISCADRLPAAFKGYRIAQISDLHIGTFKNDTAHVRRIVESVNALHPDLIVFTGDLVNFSPDEIKPFQDILSRLSAPDGVVAILGNHDYCLYAPDHSPAASRANTEAVCRIEKEMGWHLLRNESLAISRPINPPSANPGAVNGASTAQDAPAALLYIIGVENISKPPFPSRGDLGKALAGVPTEAFKILLSHDPSHWRREVIGHPSTIDLTLSGHTHAMQLSILGLSPSRLFFKEWGGHYQEGSRHLFVCTGTGGNVPFRLGAWPQISLITLDH